MKLIPPLIMAPIIVVIIIIAAVLVIETRQTIYNIDDLQDVYEELVEENLITTAALDSNVQCGIDIGNIQWQINTPCRNFGKVYWANRDDWSSEQHQLVVERVGLGRLVEPIIYEGEPASDSETEALVEDCENLLARFQALKAELDATLKDCRCCKDPGVTGCYSGLAEFDVSGGNGELWIDGEPATVTNPRMFLLPAGIHTFYRVKNWIVWTDPVSDDYQALQQYGINLVPGGGENKDYCGNDYCGNDESKTTCPEDCGNPGYCGDGTCDSDLRETVYSCPKDCGNPQPTCGNGACERTLGENERNCPEDCVVCGDGSCYGPLETKNNCCTDCGCLEGFTCTNNVCTENPQVPICGDKQCETSLGETAENCPEDCYVAICEDGICETELDETEANCPGDCSLVCCKLEGTWIPPGGEEPYYEKQSPVVCRDRGQIVDEKHCNGGYVDINLLLLIGIGGFFILGILVIIGAYIALKKLKVIR